MIWPGNADWLHQPDWLFQEATYAYDEVGNEEEGLGEGLEARAHLGWPCPITLYIVMGRGRSRGGWWALSQAPYFAFPKHDAEIRLTRFMSHRYKRMAWRGSDDKSPDTQQEHDPFMTIGRFKIWQFINVHKKRSHQYQYWAIFLANTTYEMR